MLKEKVRKTVAISLFYKENQKSQSETTSTSNKQFLVSSSSEKNGFKYEIAESDQSSYIGHLLHWANYQLSIILQLSFPSFHLFVGGGEG